MIGASGFYCEMSGASDLPSSFNIVFCQKNLQLYSQSVYDLLKQQYPDVVIEVKDCVDKCGMCTDVPFAIRDNALVGGRDARGLYRKLERGMQFLARPPLPGTCSYKEPAPEVSLSPVK